MVRSSPSFVYCTTPYQQTQQHNHDSMPTSMKQLPCLRNKSNLLSRTPNIHTHIIWMEPIHKCKYLSQCECPSEWDWTWHKNWFIAFDVDKYVISIFWETLDNWNSVCAELHCHWIIHYAMKSWPWQTDSVLPSKAAVPPMVCLPSHPMYL